MPIKFIPQFQSEDGKLHDSLEKAISHDRRLAIQHMLLDNREKLHLSLAEIDKAATILCAVQGKVADIFSVDRKADLDISAAKEIFPTEVRPGKMSPEDQAALEVSLRAEDRRLEADRAVPPMTHTDIRAYEAFDSLGTPLVKGDLVRLVAGAPQKNIDEWGDIQYRLINDIVEKNRAVVSGLGTYDTRAFIKRATKPIFPGVPAFGESGGMVS